MRSWRLSLDDRFLEAIRAAGEAAGIGDHYWDAWGQRHETPPEATLSLLSALGYDATSAQTLTASLESRKAAEQARILPITLVAGENAQPVAWTVSPRYNGKPLHYELVLEDGSTLAWQDTPAAPRRLPLGYHRLSAVWSEGRQSRRDECHLIVCPDRAYLPPSLAEGGRRAGVAVSLFGVRSKRAWGCGDFTALHGVIDWAADQMGAAFVALNPLQAIHNRVPYNTSPYLPNSLHYRNFLYIDVEGAPDFAESALARKLRTAPTTDELIRELNDSELVDYEAVSALKLRFLTLLFRSFWQKHWRRGTARAQAFQSYVKNEGERLELYALYSALDDYIHLRHPDVWIWQDWPEEYRDPRSDACCEFAAKHARRLLFHKYVQWLVDEQCAKAQRHARERGMEIGLFHDLPVAADSCGFELWAHREYYVSGCRVGAPPDDFAPQGQDWAFPPPNRGRHQETGYLHFASAIRASARHGGALRMDHVMRLFRLFWIANGFPAEQGTFVRDFGDDLVRILALESVRNEVLIVGEDLGTVDPEIRVTLARFGILSYRLFYFERDDDGRFKRPDEYPAQALVSSTTHDLPTLAGFWSGRDIDVRVTAGVTSEEDAHRMRERRRQDKQRMLDALFEAGLMPDHYTRNADDLTELTGELHNAIAGFLSLAPSMLLTLNQEDLTKELDQQNLPGTVHEYPNWRRKMRLSVEDLSTSRMARDCARMLRTWLEKTGRASPRAKKGIGKST